MSFNDERDNNETVDERGYSWLVDIHGKIIYHYNGDRIPGRPKRILTKSKFKEYDSSQGHCNLCGRLTCRGNCFK